VLESLVWAINRSKALEVCGWSLPLNSRVRATEYKTRMWTATEPATAYGAYARLQNVTVASIVARHVIGWPTKQLLIGSDNRGSGANGRAHCMPL
jgi:hypothetical protein